MFVRTELHKL